MSDRQMQLGGLLRAAELPPIQLDSTLVPAEPYLSQCIQRAIVTVMPVESQQLRNLFFGPVIQLALGKHLSILESGGVVIGRNLDGSFEQYLSVIEDVALQSDSGKQTHGLD